MALIPSALATELKTIFTEMEADPMDHSIYADKLAQAITNHILTADVNTVVSGGTVPPSGGPVAGATGVGKLS